ncbi:MAG: hypothetical protein V4489_00985 [Chlamydiota bacterium]
MFKKTSEVQHSSDADYVFLQDDTGQDWIYKQIADPSPDNQIVIVLETFASKMARAVGIPINEARTISPSESFDYRLFDKYPGSLHLKVQGKCVNDFSTWVDDFDIHQKFRSPFRIARLGPLPEEEIGLRRIIIQNMAKNKDLAKLVALDTYLGNCDRSSLNMFYDEEKDSFYGIDMGNCFAGNLAKCAESKITDFFAKEASFSEQELSGLRHYKEALLSLTSKFSPAETIALLESSLEEAGFLPSNPLLWNEDVEQKINTWKLLIDLNHKSSLRLISILDI